MKTKRTGLLKGIISAVFMIALVVTVFAVMPLTASATNVSNTVYTSNLVENDELVLTGDTTLFVNADLTLKSISGDYTLEIQGDGKHTLTVNNPNGCAINVKTLQSVKPSQGTVNLTVKGGNSKYAIYAEEDISLSGINLNVSGGAGIRSYEGNITINGTHVSVVGENGVAIIANSGSISIDSDYLFVQCAGQSGDAQWEHGIGAVGDITINSADATITGLYGVDSDKGNITLSGNIWVGATRCAVTANEGTITMTGAITAQSSDDYYVIAASGDISFNGTKLDVEGSAGIRSAEGDITINGTDVSVVGQDGGAILANSGSINIDSDYLFVQCEGQSNETDWQHGVAGMQDVTIVSEDATIVGSSYGVYSENGNISLSGKIDVGANKYGIYAKSGKINMSGAFTVQSNSIGIGAQTGLTINGAVNATSTNTCIGTVEGDIIINADVTATTTSSAAFLNRGGNIIINGGKVTVQGGNDGSWPYGIAATGNIEIAEGATVIAKGGDAIYSEKGNITIAGTVTALAYGKDGYGIHAKAGSITISGSATIPTSYIAIGAQTGLTISGPVNATSTNTCIGTVDGDIIINANVTATTTSSAGLLNREGNIIINGGKVTVQGGNDGDWAYGIAATGNIEIAEGATVIAKGGTAIYSEKGNITVAGVVTASAYRDDNFGYGIHAKAGSITISGSATIPTSYIAIGAYTDLTISGPVNATSTNTCIGTVDGDIIINANVTATTTFSAALLNRGGSIIINSGTIDVQGGKNGDWAYGIAAYENIIIRKNAMVIALGGKALFAQTGTIAIDQPLKIAVPGNGHIEGDTVVDTNGDSASHVEITNTISDTISISINAPVAGEKPVSSAKDVYGLPEHTSVKSIEWFVSDISHGNNEPFIAGQNYKVKIILKADAGYRFAYGIAAKLNGKDVTVGWNDGGKELFITYTFSDCPASIKNVELTVVAPSDGNSISYSVTDESAGYSAGNNSNYVSWYVSNDGVSYTLMSSGDKFVGGKYYKIEIIVKTHTGYEFALKDVGSIQPDVTATINGFKATVTKGYEQDPSEEITVTYIFGLCNDTIIEDIKIVDVPKPIPGEKPVYTVAVSGTGYSIVNKNSSQEVFEGGKYVNKYYIRNGIGWYDVTADNWIYETDTFIAGHDYQCVVYIQTDDGYKFVQDLYADPEVWPTATVNGNAATILKEGSGLIWNQQVRYTFIYEVQSVTEVEVSDIDVPVGNKTPDYTATLGKAGLYEFAPYGYELVGFYWYDSNNNTMTASDKFVKGETYKLEIKLVRKMDGQRVLTQFQTPVTAVLNGKVVDSSDVMANSTTVYIYQTYTCDTEYLIEIDSVSATIPNPLAGEKPDYDAIAGDDDKYTVTINAWYEDSIARGIGDSNFFAPDSYFIEGRSYHVKVTFTPKPGYKFADDVVFIINGQNATTWGREGQEQTSFTAAKNPKNTYLVTYSPTEGSGTMVGDVVAEGVSFTLDECEYVAPTGYKFKAWAIGSPSGELKYPGQTIIITSETYLIYAVWEPLPHTCVGIHESGQDATCTVDGWGDYYRCECGKYYEDENCTIPIANFEAWKIGAGKIAAAHKYGTLIPAVSEKHTQTELSPSVAAHYHCACGKYFTEAKVETTLGALTGETPSHSYGAWQTNDNKHWKECSCGLKSEENDHIYDNASDMICNTCEHDRTLPHTHGNGVKQNGQSATCTVDGWKDYYKCSCGKFYTEEACTNEITSLDAWKEGAGKIAAEHNYGTLVSAVTEKHTQTELVASVAAHYHCSTCGKYFTEAKAETTLDALTGTTPSHSYGDWKTDADKHWKECSCGKKSDEGNHVDSDSNNKCDTCDKTLPGGGGVTPPPAHTHDYGTAWKTDGENHWYECSCGDKKDSAAHSGGTATCKAKAKCSVCNTEYGELAEHKYSEATCTAKAKCSECGNETGELAAHNYVEGKCSCGATDPNYVPPHEHNFVEGKCSCGETDPNYVPPHEHNFVEGKCECGETDPNYNPGTDDPEEPDEGLGAGAITGIAVGSVAVVGGGGFALFWFVLKKKTWADLLMVFKK